jgi:hypothetical protein
MGLLSKKIDSNPERDLAALRARKSALAAQLASSEQRLAEAVADRRTRLLESDLDNGQPVKSVVGKLRDEADAIRDALAAIDEKVLVIEAKLAAEQDRAAREREAKVRKEQVEQARRAADKFKIAAEEVVASLQPFSVISLSAGAAATSTKCLTDQLALHDRDSGAKRPRSTAPKPAAPPVGAAGEL